MHKLNRLKEKLGFLEMEKDIIGHLSMSSIKVKTYLPYSTSALRFSTLSNILNDIVINNRRSTIEFGGGISTVYLAKLAKVNNIDLKITTIDHDKDWLAILNSILKNEKVSSFVNLIHGSMALSELSLNDLKWYDNQIVSKKIGNAKFDQVIVDGPLAYKRDLELSRYPALPFLENRLMDKNAVFLDDTNRHGEKKIMKLWEKRFSRSFIKLNSSSSVSFEGEYFNII